VALAIGGFLAALWRNGALVGNTPEEAFFVRCDDENNPPAIIDNGQLVIDVGVALVQPAEFVIVRVGRTQDELELTELNRVEA
jgi:phage tail sheath protein FI